MDYILKQLTKKLPSIKKINIFSDGASQQFKQRYRFSNLHIWEEKFDVKIIWNFFATSHGKAVVDGLGGTVKRSVWRHIKSEKAHITSAKEYSMVAQEQNPSIHIQYITSAKEYSMVAKEQNPSIHIQYITKEEIALQKTFLDAHWDGVLPVPKTHQRHCYIPKGKDKVMVADTSDATEFTTVAIRSLPATTNTTNTESITDVIVPRGSDCSQLI